MNDWSASIIADVAHGRWLRSPRIEPCGASIDTRTIEPGNIFFALRGDHVDGHDYVLAAGERGASICVIDGEGAAWAEAQSGILLVDSVKGAMARLAGAWRDRLRSTRVVGVTGSAGKTTTVRLLDAALGATMSGTASRKSFNNDLGVPLTLLNARPSHDYLVCEMGSNAPGEIDRLSSIVRPDVGVITSIGRAHLAGFQSIEGVAREKASITRHLRPGGCAVVSADSPLLLRAITPGTPVRTFGYADHADLRVLDVHHEGRALDVLLHDGRRLRIAFPGRHNACNAAAALLVARALGLDDAPTIAGLASARPAEHRLQVEDLPSTPPLRLIDDAYNANPESMLAALSTLCEIGQDATRRVAIIGDMLELGDYSLDAHREVLSRAADLPIDLTIAIGPAFAEAARRAPEARAGRRTETIPDPDDEALAPLVDRLRPGDAVLVKASRAIRLERVCNEIRRRFAMADAASADNR